MFPMTVPDLRFLSAKHESRFELSSGLSEVAVGELMLSYLGICILWYVA